MANQKPERTVLIISQTFVPDPAAVGQYMADVAFALAERGHRVRVYASGRGYEDPSAIYPRREILYGADVRRFGLGSFGKKSILLRVLGTASFMLQAFLAAMFTPKLAGIFFSTSPPTDWVTPVRRRLDPPGTGGLLGDGPKPRPTYCAR